MQSKFSRSQTIGCWFILPQLVVTALFFIWPSLQAMFQSFFFSDPFGLQQRFAGFHHFIDLFQNRDYGRAVWITLMMSVAVTFFTMTFGLLLALMVNARKKSQPIYQSLLLWPYAIAPAVAAILWRFLFHPSLGWLTEGLRALGIEFNYLLHPTQAMWVVIITASWQQFSYDFLFYYAALKLIPKSLIEAAIMDGAGSIHRFVHIILPLLSPTTFFLLTMNLIYAFFDTFGIIQVLTHGGPGNSTTTLVYKVYKDGFIGMDLGGGSAQSVILMLLVFSLTMLQFRFLEKKVHYQ